MTTVQRPRRSVRSEDEVLKIPESVFARTIVIHAVNGLESSSLKPGPLWQWVLVELGVAFPETGPYKGLEGGAKGVPTAAPMRVSGSFRLSLSCQ